jgi:hypothetical protein
MQSDMALNQISVIKAFTYGAPLIISRSDCLKRVLENVDICNREKKIQVLVLNVVHNLDLVPRLLEKSVITLFAKFSMFLKSALKVNMDSWFDDLSSSLETIDGFLPFGNFLLIHKKKGYLDALELSCEQLTRSSIWKCSVADLMKNALNDHSMVEGYANALELIRSNFSQTIEATLGEIKRSSLEKMKDIPLSEDSKSAATTSLIEKEPEAKSDQMEIVESKETDHVSLIRPRIAEAYQENGWKEALIHNPGVDLQSNGKVADFVEDTHLTIEQRKVAAMASSKLMNEFELNSLQVLMKRQELPFHEEVREAIQMSSSESLPSTSREILKQSRLKTLAILFQKRLLLETEFTSLVDMVERNQKIEPIGRSINTMFDTPEPLAITLKKILQDTSQETSPESKRESSPASPTTNLDDLLTLAANLYEQGMLSEDEFALVQEILEDTMHPLHVSMVKEFIRFSNTPKALVSTIKRRIKKAQ